MVNALAYSYLFWPAFIGLMLYTMHLGHLQFDFKKMLSSPFKTPFDPELVWPQEYVYTAVQKFRFLLGVFMGVFFVYAGWIAGFTDMLKDEPIMKGYAQILLFMWGCFSVVLHSQMYYERVTLKNQIASPGVVFTCTLGQAVYLFFLVVWCQQVNALGRPETFKMMLSAACGGGCVVLVNIFRLAAFLAAGEDDRRFTKYFLEPVKEKAAAAT